MYLTKKIKAGWLIEVLNKQENEKKRLLYSNQQLASIGLSNESDPNAAYGAVESNQAHVVNNLWPERTPECYVCGEKLYGWDKVVVKHYHLCQLCFSDRLDLQE